MLSQFFIVGVSLTLSVFVGSLGSSRLGISQILSQYFGLLLVINSGIGESANRIISQYFGAGNYREMQRVGNISLLMNAAIYSTVAITYDIFSKPLASVFLDSDTQGEDIEALIRYNFIIMSLGNFFAALQENCRTNLSAVNDTMLSSVVPFITYVAMVLPMAAIATYVLNFDLYGIIGAMSIATFINLSVVGKYWFKHSNQIVAANDDTVVTSNEKTTQFFGNSCHKLKSFFCADKRADTQSSVHTILRISKRNRHPIHKDPESARFTAISENEELDEKQLVV
jgi:Na+-driven multidrug efflux pump